MAGTHHACPSRRHFLQLAGSAGAAGLAACTAGARAPVPGASSTGALPPAGTAAATNATRASAAPSTPPPVQCPPAHARREIRGRPASRAVGRERADRPDPR